MKGSNMELAEREDPPKKRMNWIVGGVLLGLLNTYAVASYGALGASRSQCPVRCYCICIEQPQQYSADNPVHTFFWWIFPFSEFHVASFHVSCNLCSTSSDPAFC